MAFRHLQRPSVDRRRREHVDVFGAASIIGLDCEYPAGWPDSHPYLGGDRRWGELVAVPSCESGISVARRRSASRRFADPPR